MFKRFIALLVAVFLLCSIPVSAAEHRAAGGIPSLTFNGTTATCKYQYVNFGSEIAVTLELWRGSKLVASWSATGTTTVYINEQYTVVTGATYTLKASGTCDGVAFTSSSVIGTCP